MLYLMNPGGKTKHRGGRMARKARKRRTAAQRRATAKMIAANKSRRRGKASKRVTKRRRRKVAAATVVRKRRKRRAAPVVHHRRKRRGVTMARRRKSTAKRRRRSGGIKVARRRRSSYRRNPPFIGGIIRGLKQGAFGLGGSVATGFLGGMIPLADSKIMTPAKYLLAAAAVDMAASKFLPAAVSDHVRTGAYMSMWKNVLGALAPNVAGMLGSYSEGPALSGYSSEVLGSGDNPPDYGANADLSSYSYADG